MGVARISGTVPLAPAEAFELWTSVRRWATFVDGFAHEDRLDPSWPEPGAKVVWRSVPGGRGLVTETVVRSEPGVLFSTTVLEERLDGTQTATFEADDEGARMLLELDYKVTVGGPLRPVVDALFIRRAQNDALARTLRRFRTEAAEQAAL
jgi:hypothetical protein